MNVAICNRCLLINLASCDDIQRNGIRKLRNSRNTLSALHRPVPHSTQKTLGALLLVDRGLQ